MDIVVESGKGLQSTGSDIFNSCLDEGVLLYLKGEALSFKSLHGALSEELRQLIRENKQLIIDFLLSFVDKSEGIGAYNVLKVLPLSMAQERLWFVDQFEGGSAQYNIANAIAFKGELNYQALEDTLQAILDRHESLRTVFKVGEDAKPYQVVQHNAQIKLEKIDFSESDEDDRKRKTSQFLAEDTGKPFDLSTDNMLRASLVKQADRDYVLLVTVHHICSDGWSMNILTDEFNRLYSAFSLGQKSPLPELKVQYSDYAHWQRNWLQDAVVDKQLSYWQENLKGLPELHSLPLDKPRPTHQTFNGAIYHRMIAPSMYKPFKALCQSEGATLFMGLHAILSILLSRLSGETDVVIGSPVANREQAEVAPLIGFFVNNLVLRTDLSESEDFLSVLSLCKTTALDAYEHQQVPFEQVVNAVKPVRSLAHSPLFQIMLILQNNDSSDLSVQDINLSAVALESAVAKYDLTINVGESPQGLYIGWEHNIDLFDACTIERFACYFERLIEEVVSSPQVNYHSLPLLPNEEQHKLLVEWNNTHSKFETETCLHELFERQAAKTPSQNAIFFGDTCLTYSDVNLRANKLANYLIQQGVSEEEFVGVCVDRSPMMVIAWLAVMKTGAAYFALDPEHPKQRLAYMIGNAKLSAVIVDQFGAEKVEGDEIKRIHIDECEKEILDQSSGNPDIKSSSQNPAYVIYTSGSTGQPKGIATTHRNILNRCYWMWQSFPFESTEVCLQKTAVSFVDSVWETWGPLLQGVPLVLSTADEAKDYRELLKLIENHGVTRFVCVPSLLAAMMQEGEDFQRATASLQYCSTSGETLPLSVAKRLYELSPEITLLNIYGSSEVSADASCMLVTEDALKSGEITIGKPIANTQFYVLNKTLQTVPVGVAGELYVGGDGVVGGYLNQPELTKEKFIANPFSESADKASNLFKTGDLVRWLPNAEIEYVGRADNQVKIRGFRIELEEVEAALLEHENIAEAVLSSHKDASGQACLIAYVVKKNDESETSSDSLRTFLGQRLPDYMLPSTFMFLSALPLSFNGKIDRKALPEPDASLLQQEYVAPRSETEKGLCDIWQDVLGVESVGIHDNFFNLGGHSLLAVRLANLIETAFDKSLTLRTFLTLPTVAEQAVHLDESQAERFSFQQAKLDPANRDQPFELTEIQQAYWLGRKGEFELGNVSTHVYSEFPWPEIDVARVESVINLLIQRHDMLRMVVTPDGQQKVLASVPEYQVTCYDYSEMTDSEAEKSLLSVREELSHQVFPAESWPLFDIRISRFSEGRAVLHYSMDMLVMDASSSTILGREFATLYFHPEAELAPLSLTFRDYVNSERALKESTVYQNAKKYWYDRFDDFPARPELPLAIDPSLIQTPRFERRSHWLATSKWQKLKKFAQNHQVTPTVLLLNCIGEVLNRWAQSPHFALNLTLFNRLPFHPEVDALVGDFTSLTLLEMDYRDNKRSFIERLKRVQERLWSDLEMRYFGGMEVQRALTQESGERANYPVVVTSTIGLTPNADAEEQSESAERYEEAQLKANDSSQGGYTITQTSQVWLDVQLSEAGGGLLYNWDSVEGLFPEGMLDDMFTAMASVLDTLAEDATAWQQPQLITLPATQTAIVAEANATETAIEPALLHANIEQSITQYGSKTAVLSLSKALSYQELGERSDALACSLVAGGAQTNQLIAIVMEKGWEQIVAVLGILRSGAAYLPIDGSLPAERIALLLESGEVSQVITIAAYTDVLPAGYTVHVLDEAYVPASDTECLNTVATQPADLAYVIFTSGSTGQPKGVMIAHGPAHNTVQDINQRYGVTSDDRMLGMSNLSFDLSVYDIFGVLGAGGTLVLPQPEEYRDPQAWGAYLREEGITLWNTVPPLMQMLVDAEQIDADVVYEDTVDLRLVLLSGDWIPTDLPGRIKRLAPSADVISLGGATEASIWSISYPIDEVDPSWPSIPYGKALANQQFYVLKEDYSPAPLWVTGDLYIGGVGLAEGYWRDEAKTSASFVTHPETGARLYKTGDRGRLLADGNIEFKGRIDTQVKVQGYRIELGEIEAQLKRHEDVKDTVVITYPVNNSHQLVGYVVYEDVPGTTIEQAPATENDPTTEGSTTAATPTAGVKLLSVAEKLEFKLAQKGVRREGVEAGIAFPAIEGNASVRVRQPAAQRRVQMHPASVAEGIEDAELGALLGLFYRQSFAGQTFAKGYYPSGGTLYPVQVYVRLAPGYVSQPSPLSAGGDYYYHPLQHALQPISASTGANESATDAIEANGDIQGGFELYLVADMDAITPLYGDLAESLCQLEAGYMAHLVEHAIRSRVSARRVQHPADDTTLPTRLGLGAQHRLLQVMQGGIVADEHEPASVLDSLGLDSYSIDYASRKSYRQYLEQAPQVETLLTYLATLHDYHQYRPLTCDYYVVIRRPLVSEHGEDLTPGSYRYVLDQQQLVPVVTGIEGLLCLGDNRRIEEGASFGVVMVSHSSAHRAASLCEAGEVGQLLSHASVAAELGLCAIGAVDPSVARQALALSDAEQVVHMLLGGCVSAAQIEAFPTDEGAADSGHDPHKALEAHLTQVLPSYMVPSVFITLPEIPLSANGKVDRKALPAPQLSVWEQGYVAPRTPLETQLCAIWQDVLQVEQVGIYDNFFHLGGHSLLAVRLANAVEAALDKALPIGTILSQATVAEQAEYLLEHRGERHSFEQIIPAPEARHQPFPLTEIQRAYWLGRSGDFELGNVATHSYSEFPIPGLDTERLQTVVNQFIERHDMYRMVVDAHGQQRILEQVPTYQVTCYDYQDLAGDAAERALHEIREELSHQVLAADTWPLFDIRVSQWPDGHTILHYSMDMLVMDASSTLMAGGEFAHMYAYPEQPLEPLSLTFRDYVLAEKALQTSPIYQHSQEYWLSRLADFPARPDLPLAKDPSQIHTPRFERRHHRIGPATWQRLKAQAQAHQVTPTVLVLGCFGEVIRHWSQQPHFALNLTLFNRMPMHPEVDQVVGDFTSLTLLEMDYREASDGFAANLTRIQKQLWNDLEHRYFGGLEVQRALAREQGQVSSFPVVVTSTLGLESESEEEKAQREAMLREAQDQADTADEQAASAEGFYSITQTSQVWLDVQLSEAGGALHYNWDSVEGLFPEGMLDDMFAAMANVLDTLAEDATAWQQPQLITLPEAQAAIVAEANATETAIAPALLHANLEQSITQYGSKTAVQSLSKALSYQELGERSDALACALVTGGAQTNQLIAIVMEKGWEQIVAVLGILRSGAAYLPIDGSLPAERIALLLASGEVSQVITTAAYTDVLPAGYRVHVLDEAYVPASDTECLNTVATQPADLAYVIFTSGSTGQPKGVMIAHGPAHNTVQDINQRYGVTSDDRMLGMSNLSFDLSVYDIFGVLGAGGTLVLPQPEEYRDPQAWGAYLREEGITLWNTVPPLMQMLVDAEQIDADVAYEDTVDLRLVLLSGDWIPTDLPGRIKRLAPSAEVISLGGATEASIWSISYPIDEVDPSWPSIPYGKALANQQFYVLKEDYSPAPLWVTGDLYIGGVGLAEGYWRDEAKTSASFVTHSETGARLYKTGDRGRLLADGNIEFKGRIDTQVKVQGYRIELGEIEAQLKAHALINEAVVNVYSDGGVQHLLGYIVCDLDKVIAAVQVKESGGADDVQVRETANDLDVDATDFTPMASQELIRELIQFLGERLPHYMIPQQIIPIDAIPLSANGKINRKALPIPEVVSAHNTYVAPENETERALCEICCNVLGLKQVGVMDNFFRLGGDSLLSVRVVTEVREQLKVDISIREIFSVLNLRDLANTIEQKIVATELAKERQENEVKAKGWI